MSSQIDIFRKGCVECPQIDTLFPHITSISTHSLPSTSILHKKDWSRKRLSTYFSEISAATQETMSKPFLPLFSAMMSKKLILTPFKIIGFTLRDFSEKRVKLEPRDFVQKVFHTYPSFSIKSWSSFVGVSSNGLSFPSPPLPPTFSSMDSMWSQIDHIIHSTEQCLGVRVGMKNLFS